MFISKRCKCSSKNSQSGKFDKKMEQLTKDLNILSVKSRLDILFLLKDKPHCVCDLMSHTDMSQSLISHHLSDLTNAGFLEGKREGKYIDYYLTKKGEKTVKSLSEMIGI